MKVSIITVTRNSATTLVDALRSVAEQRHPNVEHIVIDGASTDATDKVVEQHGDRVAKYVSEPDTGIYDAMNKGLSIASGEVIGFLNADDRYSDPGVLERIVAAMSQEGLDIVYGDVAFFRGDDSQSIVRHYRSDRFHPERLAWGWMPAHPAFFMRREIYQRVGSFKTDYRIAGDFEMMVRIFQNTDLRFKYLSEILVMMRSGGISNEGWRNTLLLNLEVLRACRENGLNTNWIKILSKYPLKFFEYINAAHGK